MPDEPLRIRPARTEPRRDPPDHTSPGSEDEHRPLSALDARDLAARRLAEHVSRGRSREVDADD